LQAIAESKNPDVIALRALLESDKDKSRAMLEQKKQVVEKWTGVCADMRQKKAALQDSIAQARAENVKLKDELSSVRAMYKAEREALSLIAREEMRLEHAAALAMLRDASQEGDKAARPENIAAMSALLAAALEKLRAASAAGEPVDPELMDVVRLLKSYLNFVRGVAYNASDPDLAARAVEAAALAAAVEQFDAVFSDASPQNVGRLIDAIRSGMGRVEQVCKQLEEKEEKIEAMEDGKLQDAAEQQLREAAMRIEQAAKQINAIRMAPRSQDFGLGALKVCDALLAATEDLALITGKLVYHATLAQKERKTQELNAGSGEEMREQYRQNQTWVNGLISAAQAAAYRISLLVQIANRVMQKQQSWEYIIAGSEEVQMAGVQLVTAARAKLDSFSPNNRNLQTTQQELSVSVKKLITTANEFHEEVEPPAVRTEELSANKANTAIYQHKSDVEALEVALKKEQMQLLELLTQASGGRTDDLSLRNNATAEVVNRSDESPRGPPPGVGQPSPRKLTNPFAVPSASMFEAPKSAAPVIKTPLFGGAVAAAPKSSPAITVPFSPFSAPVKQVVAIPAPAPAPVVPSAAMFEAPKATPPVAMKKMPSAGPKAALATSPVQQAPLVASPAKAAAPAKFDPFAAVKSGAPVKRGAIPPPPPAAGGAPPGGGRSVPPPPK
jgi:predicted nuclease with TOPRIM domain